MIDVELDEAMADLLAEASEQVDGTLPASHVHPVGADPWRGPAMTRLCRAGLFEFRERPVCHYKLTEAGSATARVVTNTNAGATVATGLTWEENQ